MAKRERKKKFIKSQRNCLHKQTRLVFTLPFNILSRRAAVAVKPTGKYGAKEVNCQLIVSANICTANKNHFSLTLNGN